MLKTIVTTLIIIVALTASAQEKYLIEGKLDGLNEGNKAMLMYTLENRLVRDSTNIINGTFQFVGTLNNPLRARIAIYKEGQRASMTNAREFYLENTKFEIKGPTLALATIKGGKEQEGYVAYNAMLKPFYDEMVPFRSKISQYAKENKKDSVELMTAAMTQIYDKIGRAEEAYIRKYNNTYLALSLVNDRTRIIDEAVLAPLFNGLTAQLRESTLGKSIAERLALATKPGSGIGTMAADFVLNDLTGKPVSLASLKGKYVLVDFWASWCAPCRQENPALKLIYTKFNKNNFEILGVSLDSDKNLWQKAVEADGLPWIHASDLKGMENKAAILYNVKIIPQNFLVAPDGKIVGKDLHGKELDEKLSTLLKK